MLLLIGFSAVLFELNWLIHYKFGWPAIGFGIMLLAIHYLLPLIRSNRTPEQPKPVFKPLKKIDPELPLEESIPVLASSKSISFVARGEGGTPAADIVSKTLTPDIVNVRFLAYRCEISEQSLRGIYQNASQRELKWYEISSITVRQMPNQQPWEGKLILDIVPNSLPNEQIQPIRISSATFVNYSALPQGQSASTRENLRRLAAFALSKHRLIFLDPGTDYFVHAGQPPVKFVSMAQFKEYDSRY